MAFFHKGQKRKEEIEEEKKQQLKKELHELKVDFILEIIMNSNNNMDDFFIFYVKTPNIHDLIESMYGKIMGYDFSYKTEKFETRNGRFGLKIVENKQENNNPMNLEKVKIIYKNNSLTILDDKTVYNYEIDEHYLIYLNKEKLPLGSYIFTDEEIRKNRQYLFDNMQSYKKRHDEDMIASMEFAKKYYVK